MTKVMCFAKLAEGHSQPSMTPAALPTTSTPATPKRISVFSASYVPSQLGSSVSKVNRFLSPTKKRQMIFGTPVHTSTPSRGPLPTVLATPRTDIIKQLPEPPQIPDGRVGYDPELRNILANHEDALDQLIDRYSRLKSDLSHQLNVDLAELEHQKTNAKCELAVIQKQLTENIEANDKLKLELIAARNRLNKLSGDSREMELKLSELHSVFNSCKIKFTTLENTKNSEKSLLNQVVSETKNEVEFLQEISGLTIVILGPDRLRFNFKLIDMNAYDRVFYIELDLSEFDYRIISIDPSPPEIKSILKRLNQTRDFNRFLCEVRLAFKKSMKT
ncbi:hypothetical protein PSHT_12646 [Puccinia striiformis]|uniref:Kinetochore protein SPC25 n=1 Tax=Puccinia striiformis TaxID=27350 RepID=A0A2S4UVH1_9BASI|nr:hypothetical protein PSHT_12646 [Puccinia striiformis]